MAAVVRNLLLFVVNPECYTKFFEEFNFLDGPCLKYTLSKCLGLGIIAGSLMVKIPQIVKILKNQSVEGLSILSVLLDLSAMTFSTAYSFTKGFPFSSWGEGLSLMLQTATIAALIFYFAWSEANAILFIVTYLGVTYVLMGGLTPDPVLLFLQALVVPVVLIGKLIQAWANYKNGSTGQLSAITGFMLLGGSSARIFTSIQETGDAMLVLTYSCATLANAIIAAQMLYYWNVPAKEEKKVHSKSKKAL